MPKTTRMIFIGGFFAMVFSQVQAESAEEAGRRFTVQGSERFQEFEAKIAYMYGVRNPQPVIDLYMKAVKSYNEQKRKVNSDRLREVVQPLFKAAYDEVRKQLNFDFDTKITAGYEFDLVDANTEGKPFEEVSIIMENLYKTVFEAHKDKPNWKESICKAAWLRTFLYQYKVTYQSQKNGLPGSDIRLLEAIAERSREALNSLIN